MPVDTHSWALRLRERLVPEALGMGWIPFYLLGYLVFLFLPLAFGISGEFGDSGMPAINFWCTVVSVLVFLPIYFATYRASGFAAIAGMLGIAAVAYALLPLNGFANTYIIYAAGAAARVGRPLLQRIGWLLLVLGIFLLELLYLQIPQFVFALTLIIAIAVFAASYFQLENMRKRSELKLSHDEVRRLAALAERERIGRDLHDLLGHTLSLVALKSDLAARLLQRDPAAEKNAAALHEIREVSRVAREALSQVRAAVSGIRAAGMAAELASAKLLLESDGVTFKYDFDVRGLDGSALPPRVETTLALTVREAVTNIQRHACARHADVAFVTDAGEAVLRISDDGRGGAMVPGNGLGGMRERVEALGGRLRVESGKGRGTHIEVRLPLAANDDTSGGISMDAATLDSIAHDSSAHDSSADDSSAPVNVDA